MLELVEEAFDAIALLVEIGVVWPLDLTVALGRNDDLGTVFCEPLDEVVGIISFVGNGDLGVDAIDQIVGEDNVIALAGRADQSQRKAKGLGGGMDLGAQSAARPAQTLGMRPPLT